LSDEWLSGWDFTEGIVSVWVDRDAEATLWRRSPATGELTREAVPFRPWLLLDSVDHLDDEDVTWRELEGPGALRFHVSADSSKALGSAVVRAAAQRFGRRIQHASEIDKSSILLLPPEEQYLVESGRAYFHGLTFDQLHRLQFDLETTGLNANRDRIFMIAMRDPAGRVEILESASGDDRVEAHLIRRFVERVRAADPDVIENHNLHGFDLPFLERRATTLGVPLALGRVGPPGLRRRAARRGTASDQDSRKRVRFIVPGRELIDSLDAVLRHDFSARDLPGHGLKAVAKHFGLAGPERELIRGDQIFDVYTRDPERVRRYAASDVEEAAGVARLLGGAAFALARLVPRRYERLADAGAATGVIDPLLVRAYLRAGQAIPAHEDGDGTVHTGAALHLFAIGAAHRVVKADVASLYPSLMRAFRIGPKRDRLGALLALVDGLVERRLAAKARGKAAAPGSQERHSEDAMSAAMKLVVNSAYGYLAAGGGLTRFADVHAANEVTRRGRETLDFMCRELSKRGVQLLEADTDGVYFSVPDAWSESDERRVVAEVAAQLPPLVQLEFEGRYRAMLSHEPKNYALLPYGGALILRGVAFRSSRAEPFGEAFLRAAIERLLLGDIAGVRAAYLERVLALRRLEVPTFDVSSRVRLTKTAEQYLAVRETRRELTYEALLASGRKHWSLGERVRVYRTRDGSGGVVADPNDESMTASAMPADPRNYDVDHYVRVLRDNFASRLEGAFSPDDYSAVFADPQQPSLFARPMEEISAVLTKIG
jgi:DNA polymerase elongation subunit (family B)